MSNTKHTPLPWGSDGQQIAAVENGYVVAIVSSPHPRARGKDRMEDLEYCRGNTAFIVRACNSHDKLVAALRNLIAASDAYSTVHAPDGDDAARMIQYAEAFNNARAALAAAEAA